jgi:hypothetical protein
MDLQKLVDEINRNFVPPFVDVHVWARLNERGDFILHIGPRDMQLREDGTFVGAGTVMGCES